MTILDEIKIQISAGKGGPGHCSFLRTMQTKFGGPNGGNGGNGGHVYLCGTSNLNHLGKFRWKKIFQANDGERGRNKSQHGADGENLIIYVPLGTQVFSETQDLIIDITAENQIFKIATGGKKGMGNEFFKSSTNRAPTKTTPGLPGEEITVILSLKVLADVGIIGMPNAGKSSFLRNITNSNAVVGNYQFTTLNPNLGVCYKDNKSIVIADLPGIIEKASEGKGLGISFLKHTERCKVLLHFVDISDESFQENEKIILREIQKFNSVILNKKIFLCLTKTDLMEEISQNKSQGTYLITNLNTKSYSNLLNDLFALFNETTKIKLPNIEMKNSKTF